MTDGVRKIAVLVILPCFMWAGIGYATYEPAKAVFKETRVAAHQVKGEARSAVRQVKWHAKAAYRSIRVLKREAQELLRA